MKKILISVPAYNEEENVFPLYQTLEKTLESVNNKYEFEILFIDDGSSDETVKKVKSLMKEKTNVSLIELSRNYGKEIAMVAGFDYFEHDAMVTMDADLQHPAATILDMIQLWEQGYEDVYAKRIQRKGESRFKKNTSKLYYKL